MKIEKMGLNPNKNEVKKEREAKNNFAMSKFGLPKMQNGNLKKDIVSFGSPVVYQEVIKHNQHQNFLKRLSKFIDKFEDETKHRQKECWDKRLSYNEKYNSKINSQLMSAQYLGSGMSGNAYLVKDWLTSVDDGNSNGNSLPWHYEPHPLIFEKTLTLLSGDYTQFVIKETQKSNSKNLENEFEELKKVVDMPSMQQGVALMKTRDGGTFLISEFQPGVSKGLKKRNGDKKFNVLTRQNIKDVLSILSQLDKKMLFNPDLNLGNILYEKETPTIIDLEWQTNMNEADKVFTFAPNEKRTNMLGFENAGLSSYIKDLYQINEHNGMDYKNNKKSCRDFLKMYFMERAKYCDTSNRLEKVRKAVYENPTEDVLDAEILRLSILKNHEKQYGYLDTENCQPKDMLEMVRYQARANFAAKMLSEFQPQRPYSETSRAEDEYFEEMRKFGKDWHNKTKDWYKGSINWMKRLVAGEEHQNNQSGYSYFHHLFGTGVDGAKHPYKNAVPDKTKLSDILSSSAKSKWDNVMEKEEKEVIKGRTFKIPALKETIRTLEGKFVSLKYAVDKNDYVAKNDAKEEITDLIPEVLV